MTAPYYSDEWVTIYHGDCREVLPSLPEVHLVVADPPYMNKLDEAWDRQWGNDETAFLAWLAGVLALVPLEERGTLAVFASPEMAARVEVQMATAFQVINHIVWRKPVPGSLGQADKDGMRRFWPSSERIILAEQRHGTDHHLYGFTQRARHATAREVYEDLRERLVDWRIAAGMTNKDVDLELGTNGMAGHYFGASQWELPTEEHWAKLRAAFGRRGVDVPPYAEVRQEFDAKRQEFDAKRREFDAKRQEFDAKRREFDAKRQEFDIDSRRLAFPWERYSDVWTFLPALNGGRVHPAQKPLGLLAHMVETMSRPGDVVLDPFMGSGTTLRAAKDLGRRSIGIEIEERYCDIAAKRCAQEVLAL